MFLGAMDYQPNEDAVVFFVESVVPRLRARAPGFRFVVAGKSPSARVRALDNGRDVSVTGYVDDKAALFASTTVFVVPIRIGGGTRIKILESMAAGVPVVSTRVSAEGIDAGGRESILLGDSPDEFARACGGCCWTLAAAPASAERSAARLRAVPLGSDSKPVCGDGEPARGWADGQIGRRPRSEAFSHPIG